MRLRLILAFVLSATVGSASGCGKDRSRSEANTKGIARQTLPRDTVEQASSLSSDTSVSSGNVQCDQNWLSSQSAILVSPAGFQARGEVRGKTLLGKTTDDNRCLVTYIIHVTGQSAPKTIVAGTRDDNWGNEHWIEMNGWSRDGKLLLTSMITTAGDWDATTSVVYNAQTGQVWRTELVSLFNKITPKDCFLHFSAMGFTNTGSVLLDVGSFEEDLPPGEKPCFEESRWELDFAHGLVTRVSGSAAAQRFGTVEDQK